MHPQLSHQHSPRRLGCLALTVLTSGPTTPHDERPSESRDLTYPVCCSAPSCMTLPRSQRCRRYIICGSTAGAVTKDVAVRPAETLQALSTSSPPPVRHGIKPDRVRWRDRRSMDQVETLHGWKTHKKCSCSCSSRGRHPCILALTTRSAMQSISSV